MSECHIHLRGSDGGTEPLAPAVDRFGEEAGLAPGTVGKLQIALDEVVSNVVRHGVEGDTSWQIDVHLRAVGGELEIEVVDDGPAFDPLAAEEPELDRSLEDSAIGGLGLFLVRSLTERQEYHRAGGRNRLTMTMKPEAPAPRRSEG